MQTSVLVTGAPQVKSSSIMSEGGKAENTVSDTSHQSPSHQNTTLTNITTGIYLFVGWFVLRKQEKHCHKTLPENVALITKHLLLVWILSEERG